VDYLVDCRKCGDPLEEGKSFCANCGEKVVLGKKGMDFEEFHMRGSSYIATTILTVGLILMSLGLFFWTLYRWYPYEPIVMIPVFLGTFVASPIIFVGAVWLMLANWQRRRAERKEFWKSQNK
jgi:vacuolar-type H+-ATPase subunit I/STV1